MNEHFITKLRNKELLIGTVVTLRIPEISEILSTSGFDWLWIDMEHTPISLGEAQTILQAIRGNCASVIRVPWNDDVMIKRTLDIGCDAIIIPQIKSKEEAEKAVQSCKYPPEGIRGVGLARAQGYGNDIQQYLRIANSNIGVFLQIEHAEAVNNIDKILETTGVDAIIIGPFDLSGSIGKLGDINDPDVVTAINKVKDSCIKKGIPIGIFTINKESAREKLAEGFNFVAVGVDASFLLKSGLDITNSLKK